MKKTQFELVEACFGSRQAMREKTRFEGWQLANWARKGVIPQKHWLGLLLDADANSVPLTPFIFVLHVAEAFGAARAVQRTRAKAPSPTVSA